MHLKIMLIKMIKSTLMCRQRLINKKKNEEKKNNLNGKLGDVSEKLNFRDTESDPSDVDVTNSLSKHYNFHD